MNEDPPPASIAASTGMGAVHLGVTQEARAVRFYRECVGLVELGSDGGDIRLGVPGRELVVIHPGAQRGVVPQTSGLYHLAIVVPDLAELARAVARIAKLGWEQYPTDHVMTKSDYIWDPDGNGIEIYAETPDDGTWGFDGSDFFAVDSSGIRRSGRDPIDLRKLMSTLPEDASLEAPLPEGSRMGHVHLHVASVEDSLRYYHDLMGFDLMGRMASLAFVSAGGYHHHLGLNTWAGRGAPQAPAAAAGLRHFTVELPTRKDQEETAERLARGGAPLQEEGGAFASADPSGNRLRIVHR